MMYHGPDEFCDDYDEDLEKEEEEWDEECLTLPLDYKTLFENLMDTPAEILKRKRLGPRQLVGLGYLKYALERLPRCTPGLDLEVKLYDMDRHGSTAGSYLRMTGDEMEISTFAYEQGPAGGDSSIDYVFQCESSGYCSACDEPMPTYFRLDSWLEDWNRRAADDGVILEVEFSVDDDFEWDDEPTPEDVWLKMPTVT